MAKAKAITMMQSIRRKLMQSLTITPSTRTCPNQQQQFSNRTTNWSRLYAKA